MTGYKAYQGKQIEGAGPLGLVLLSYDALYKSLGRAQLAIEAGEIGLEADHTARAIEAIIELSGSLNFEKGEEISINLANLYTYMMNELIKGMCSGKSEHLVEIKKLVETLYAGWRELNEQQQQKESTAPIPHVSMIDEQRAPAASQLIGYAA